MDDLLTRRRFLSTLTASVVAAGAPLPVGFPLADGGTFTLDIEGRNAQWKCVTTLVYKRCE